MVAEMLGGFAAAVGFNTVALVIVRGIVAACGVK